jgi:uncharacterized protein (DUF885 family)
MPVNPKPLATLVFLAAFGMPLAASAAPAADASAPAAGTARSAQDAAFAEFSEAWLMAWLDRNPEWSIYAGRYDQADRVTIPDAAYRQGELEFAAESLAALERFDPETLSPAYRIDHALIENRLKGQHWGLTEFRGFEWMPSSYNVAGPIGLLLNTPYAPEEERLAAVMARLTQVPAYYRAARESVRMPTREHIELAVIQNRGALGLLGEGLAGRVEASTLSAEDKARFEASRTAAVSAIEAWIDWLQALDAELAAENGFRSFRIGETLYEQKFRYDIQSGFTAREMYERAVSEKHRLHAMMDEIALALWPKYFPDAAPPEDRLERIGRLVAHLSDRHVARDQYLDEIKRQIPLLEAFVREHDLLEQDPSRPLVVRETPHYMRGGGAGASVSAPGPFNPTADTYYNVTPLDDYSDAEAASYLREYNHWVLQILNIHEAIPGHYTQLLHANKSSSLVKSLLRNGAMIEGWAVYAERMMLEAGWGDHAPEMWLMYGKWNLRVVTNAILDYAVHVLGMEEDEAMDLLRRQAFQEATEAANKWRRVKLSQVQLTSYFTGYAEIYDFRERYKAARGEDFDLRAFHDQFLSYGNSPVPAIVELMQE